MTATRLVRCQDQRLGPPGRSRACGCRTQQQDAEDHEDRPRQLRKVPVRPDTGSTDVRNDHVTQNEERVR